MNDVLWVLSCAVLFESGMNHRKGLFPLAAVISSHAQPPRMPAPTGNKALSLYLFGQDKSKLHFPSSSSLPQSLSGLLCSCPPLDSHPQTISPFPEDFRSLWTSLSWNQLIFPDSCSHLLSCFLIPTRNPCPACLLTSNWNVGRGYPGSALMFCGCVAQHW